MLKGGVDVADAWRSRLRNFRERVAGSAGKVSFRLISGMSGVDTKWRWV